MSNQKKKNLGQGMKPRGNQAIAENTENVVSADTGQEEAPVDLIPRAKEGEQTPNNLEVPFDASLEVPSVASHDPNSTYVIGVDLAAGDEDTLTKMLADSADSPAQMQRYDEMMTATTLERLEARPGHPIPVVSTKVRNQFPTAEDMANHPLIPPQTYEGLGQQTDGSFKLVLSVDEGYIESIRQEAENGGMTPEQWCSQQFNFFLESWWAKPKGR